MSCETEIDGPKASITHSYKYRKSEMKQQIVLTQGSRRIDFITWINWQEPGKMIKTRFPLAIKADHAVCEIQFGSIKRPTHSNTTWEMAKDEVPAQKWVDISSRHYGVALLNDSKYGYRIKDSTLELTLLRCVRYPGPLIDKEDSSGRISGYTDLGNITLRILFILIPVIMLKEVLFIGVMNLIFLFQSIPVLLERGLCHHLFPIWLLNLHR